MLVGEPKLDVDLRGGRAHAPIVQSAAYYGGYKMTELLLKAGADSNIGNEIAQTAIFWSKVRGYEDIVELLLEHHAACHSESFHNARSVRMEYLYNQH